MKTKGIGKEWYIDQFDAMADRLPPDELRSRAIDRFARLGFPTRADEGWRLTDLSPILEHPFEIAPVSRGTKIPGVWLDAPRLVFVNGWRVQESSFACPHGVRIGGAVGAPDERGNAFVALNEAFRQDGGVINVARGLSVGRPIVLQFHAAASATPVASFPGNVVVLEEGSRLTLVEIFGGEGELPSFTNGVTRVDVGPRARLEYYRIHTGGPAASLMTTLSASVAGGGELAMTTLALDGGFARDDINVILDGEGASCDLRGVSFASGTRSVGHHAAIEHRKPGGVSRELQKGVFGGAARGVFHGRIVVRPNAQKTSASQINRNLLLSDEAVVDSQPQLEIFADDVKCGHGSATGSLDDDAIFYLRSRGIDPVAARAILTRAFAEEIARTVPFETIRRRVEGSISALCGGGTE